MLESAKMGLTQVDEALQAIDNQVIAMNEQREEMEDAISELSELLGIKDEDDSAEDDSAEE